jgi:hypothetical protein
MASRWARRIESRNSKKTERSRVELRDVNLGTAEGARSGIYG